MIRIGNKTNWGGEEQPPLTPPKEGNLARKRNINCQRMK